MQIRKFPYKQRGAFLVIAMILLVVLSAIGIATMSMSTTARRVSYNYTQYLAAQNQAISVAGYGKRILSTFIDGKYFGPGTCNSAATCNIIDITFPMNGRPVLPWNAGVGTTPVFRASKPNTWWNTNAFAYEGTFAGNGNARVVVALLGANPNNPYQNTYRITGYATDNTGEVKATYQLFHVWNAYPDDPGDGTCGNNCQYAQCCSGTVCGGDVTNCESSIATYVPPGWTCSEYFVTGLGYSGSVCNNPIAPPS